LCQGEADGDATFCCGIPILIRHERIVDDLVEEEPETHAFAKHVIDGAVDGEYFLT
jgi:hypothetical protein